MTLYVRTQMWEMTDVQIFKNQSILEMTVYVRMQMWEMTDVKKFLKKKAERWLFVRHDANVRDRQHTYIQ